MAGSSTVKWSASETSLQRSSFNNIVQRGHKLDVPDALMRHAAMGRSAELGAEWEPPGVVCRKIGELLTKRSSSAPRLASLPAPPRPGQRLPPDTSAVRQVAARAAPSSGAATPSGRPEWSSMLPPRSLQQSHAVDAAHAPCPPQLQSGGGGLAAARSPGRRGEVYPPSGQEGATATPHWSTKESSLARDSFNAIASKQKLDCTEVLMRQTTMSKAAMMGPGWQPSGIVSRQIADLLTNKY